MSQWIESGQYLQDQDGLLLTLTQLNDKETRTILHKLVREHGYRGLQKPVPPGALVVHAPEPASGFLFPTDQVRVAPSGL
mmetsp:Transcript_41731/g.65164  ORF Transcript_41731/g.65164 Transcript_41731/m.65164 type:complete len:80 (+) Transcript_41731:1306-1545(+)